VAVPAYPDIAYAPTLVDTLWAICAPPAGGRKCAVDSAAISLSDILLS
jgi:hypothetical protein